MRGISPRLSDSKSESMVCRATEVSTATGTSYGIGWSAFPPYCLAHIQFYFLEKETETAFSQAFAASYAVSLSSQTEQYPRLDEPRSLSVLGLSLVLPQDMLTLPARYLHFPTPCSQACLFSAQDGG